MNDDNFYEQFGTRLKILRKERNITQTELAKHLGISPTTLVNYENANRKIPLDVAVKIAAFFNTSIDSILMVNYSSFGNTKHWNDEFKNTVFTTNEIFQIAEYANYILYKRNDD